MLLEGINFLVIIFYLTLLAKYTKKNKLIAAEMPTKHKTIPIIGWENTEKKHKKVLESFPRILIIKNFPFCISLFEMFYRSCQRSQRGFRRADPACSKQYHLIAFLLWGIDNIADFPVYRNSKCMFKWKTSNVSQGTHECRTFVRARLSLIFLQHETAY